LRRVRALLAFLDVAAGLSVARFAADELFAPFFADAFADLFAAVLVAALRAEVFFLALAIY
jgi:hypothetical protein